MELLQPATQPFDFKPITPHNSSSTHCTVAVYHTRYSGLQQPQYRLSSSRLRSLFWAAAQQYEYCTVVPKTGCPSCGKVRCDSFLAFAKHTQPSLSLSFCTRVRNKPLQYSRAAARLYFTRTPLEEGRTHRERSHGAPTAAVPLPIVLTL